MKNQEVIDGLGQDKAKSKRKRFGKVWLIILGVLIVLAVIFHKYIYDYARTYRCIYKIDKIYNNEYREITLTKEQMTEDLDYLYGAAVNTALSREYAEKYYNVDYDEIYKTFKERILNCKDEYEFAALMIALDAKLPGAHSVLNAPMDRLEYIFPMSEFADKETRTVNYSLYRQFEDRMGEYDQNVIIAIYMDGDYVLTKSTLGDLASIEELDSAKLVSLNGKPVKDVIKDIDTLNHWKYDETDGSVFVPEFYLNDGIGEKYDAEIELPDGTFIHKDLYVSPEYNMAFYYRSMLYPERYKKETAAVSASDTPAESKSYRIDIDSDRKLMYAKFTQCNIGEIEQVKSELKQALASADIENIVIDFRGNHGGQCSFVTEGVLPPLLDHDAGHINGEIYPVNEYSENFCDNKYYVCKQKIKKIGDRYRAEEDFTVKGEASKHYNIFALIGHRTFSSGDIFAYIAKQDGITLIGQNTGGDGLTGNPLQSYLPNSKLRFTFVCGNSEIYPEDGYAGVLPDIFVKEDWEIYLKKTEFGSDVGTYENRQKWDPCLLKVFELTDNAGSKKQA